MSAWRVGIAVGLLYFVPGQARAHLFHKFYEPPENQLTLDYRVVHVLLEQPDVRFEVVRSVYNGETRLRLKPGGFRRWLKRPAEPGLVWKADYQLKRWSGSLKGEVERIDQARETGLAARIDDGFARRDREAVLAAFREVFVVLLEELLGSVGRQLGDAEMMARLYPYVIGYYAVCLQAYLTIHHPSAARATHSALDGMGRAFGDPKAGMPPSPAAFQRHQRRFLRAIKEAVQR